MTTNQDRPVPWTVFFGTGVYSHAVADRQATVTFCGRPTATAREWQRPGNEPGCQVCFRRMKAKS